MALQKQLIPIPLGVGVDTKTDPKQVKLGKLSVLENRVFTKVGKLTKRFGLTAYSSSIAGGSTQLTQARTLSTFQKELSVMDSSAFYSFSEGMSAWVKKADVAAATIEASPVIRNTYEQLNATCAIVSGLILYAWEDSSGGVRASLYDAQSKQSILSNTLISSTGSVPKVAVLGDYFFVFFSDTSNRLKSRRLNSQNPVSFDAEVTVATNLNSTPFIDTAPCGSNLLLAYRTSTPSIRLGYIKQTGEFAGLSDGFPVPISHSADATSSLALAAYFQNLAGSDGIYLVYHNSTSGLVCALFNLDLSAFSPATVTLDASTTLVRNIAISFKTTSQIQAFYEVDAASSYNRHVKTNTLTRAGTAGTASVFLRSVGLHSKPFTQGSDTYLILSHESALQSGYYLVNTLGVIANRISYQNGAGNTNKQSALTTVAQVDSLTYVVPTGIKGFLTSETGTLYAVKGVQATSISFDDTTLFTKAEVGKNLHFSAGIVLGYDGASITELGFHVYPENVTAATSTTGGSIPAGTRSYKVVYEWTDAQGQIHRSAPSSAVLTTTTGTTSSVTLTIPTLRLTQKSGVSLVVYRTVTSGTTYYRVSTLASPVINSKTVDTLTFTDTLNDTAITGNQILYTQGGILENIAPPSASDCVEYSNRLVLVGCEDPNEIWLSKTFTKDEGISFSDAITLRIDEGKVGVKGVEVLDEKLILFKENALYVTVGSGPLDTGLQNDLSTPSLITADVGCTEPKSIVRTPLGLMFKSSKGFYLLDRSLKTTYIGAEVEDFNDLKVSSGILVDDTNQVRFTHTDGVCLVYDYYFGQWSTFTNYEAVSAVVCNGSYVMARSSGEINRENQSSFLDNGVPIQSRLITPWISVAGIQGYQRIYEAIFLGDQHSKALFNVKVGYNFEPHFREAFTLDTEAALGSNYFGQDSYFGASTYFGGVNDPVFQFKLKPEIQKCQSIRFEVVDYNADGTLGAGFDLSMLCILAGVKSGLNRVGVTKVMSSS